MITDIMLALGLVLTTASQLRLGDSPFGVGEACLVLWLALMAYHCLMCRVTAIGPALRRLLSFWGLFAISLSLGTMAGLVLGEKYDPTWFLHDTFAYPLLAAISCMSVIEPGAKTRLRRVAWFVATLSGVSMSLLIAGGYGLVPLPFDPWFWERFRGWSENPNQLALFCTIAALICLHLADTTHSAIGRAAALVCMAMTVVAGRMTQSDTFSYGMVAAVPVFAYIKLRAWIIAPGARAAAAMLVMVAVPVLMVSLIPVVLSASSFSTKTIVDRLSKNGGKEVQQEADLRMALWSEALHRGFETGLLGLGPGPHLAIPPEIVVDHTEASLPNTTHPAQTGAANYEAHNTLLDVFTQGGVLGAGALIWLMLVAVRRAYDVSAAGLVAVMCGFGIWCMTGDIIRLPVVWFALVLCLILERPAFHTMALSETR